MLRFANQLAMAALASIVTASHDAHIDFVQTCNENGYASQSFTVISDDGYVSQLYRIPGKASEAEAHKPAVLMMHGLLADMNFWIANSADLAPPFILVDQGYDVWLGNNRGTRFAEWHTTLDNSEAEYWNFSQEEMGLKDVSTFINYITEKTGQEKVTYIGHSQGTTQMFLAGSLNPEYFTEKVNLFVALGPVTYLQNCGVPALVKAAHKWPENTYLINQLGIYNLVDFGWLESSALQLFCAELEGACEALLAYAADANPEVDNMDRFGVFLKDYPAGNGYRNLMYYSQSILGGEYRRYDYGSIRNMDIYGTIVPPEVPLGDLNIPTALFIGSDDQLATVADNEWLIDQLSPETLIWHEIYPLGHVSFTLAKDMSWFKEDVMALVDQYATNSFATGEPTLIQ